MIRPFITFGITIILSQLIFSYIGFNFAVAILIAALCFAVLFFFLRNKNDVLNRIFICILSVIVSASVFINKSITDYQPALILVSDNSCTISGVLSEYEQENDRYFYTISDAVIDGNQTDCKIRIISDIYKIVDIDDKLIFTQATIYELGKSSNSQNIHKADGIYLGAYTDDDIQVIKAEKHTVNYYMNNIRKYISYELSTYLPKQYSAIAEAMLTGNQSNVPYQILVNFRYSGIAHLFAVSGFHLSVWTSLMSKLFDKIFNKKKYVSNVFCILFVIFFMSLTGFSKSVMRAGIMLIIMLIGKTIRHQADSLNSLFIAMSIILLINPFAISSLSLQMSFLATLGILLLAKPITQPITKCEQKIKNKHLYNLIFSSYTTIAISIVSTLFTIPISAVNFGYISIVAPITNLICMLPAQILIILSGITVLISKISFLEKPLSFIMAIIIKYLIAVTEKIASIPNAVINTMEPIIQFLFILLIALMSIFLIISRKSEKKLRITVYISSLAVAVLSFAIIFIQNQSANITVADVGNGTSVILTTGKKNIIIGCGGSNYKSFKLTNEADRIGVTDYDLLLIPRDYETENEYAYKILKRYNFSNCIASNGDYPNYITELMSEDTVFTDNCTVTLDEKTTLVYSNNDAFSGVRITSDTFSCTILFLSMSDFSQVPDEWQEGSLLITRQSLPNIDLSRFDNIIISSSKNVIYDNDNIYSTKFSGRISYKVFPSGSTTITEEKNDYK